MGSRLVVLSFAVSFVVGCAAVAQEAPKVVSLQPPRAAEVDARTCKQLVVEFDRAMSNPGHSLCGGGPTMPKVVGQPQWRNDKTLVVDVELEPDREYSFSLNCPAAQNLRGKDGRRSRRWPGRSRRCRSSCAPRRSRRSAISVR